LPGSLERREEVVTFRNLFAEDILIFIIKERWPKFSYRAHQTCSRGYFHHKNTRAVKQPLTADDLHIHHDEYSLASTVTHRTAKRS